MPAIPESAEWEDFTVSGETFQFPLIYTEGHVLTTSEAAALSRLAADNVRNNFAKTIKTAKEAGSFVLEAMQTAISDYFAGYEFGVRRGPKGEAIATGPKRDPITSRALEIARDQVRRKIRELGGKLTDYTLAEITARAKKAVEANPKFIALAAEQLAHEQTFDLGVDLDSDVEVPERKPKAAKAEKAKKAAA